MFFPQHLDSIKALGTNVVWFMPIYPVGQIKTVNSPYCISDYKGVNPEFGTLEEFKSLVAQCHQKGMSVIVDWVANHTSWDSNWMEHKEWYTLDDKGEIVSPANTGWLDVADLNFDNQDMRLAMIDAMKYWVTEVGIDGFRCDAADFVPFAFYKPSTMHPGHFPLNYLFFQKESEARNTHTYRFLSQNPVSRWPRIRNISSQ